jgi:hypothetical protein
MQCKIKAGQDAGVYRKSHENNSGTGCWSVPEVQYKITAIQDVGVYRKCNGK